MSLFAIELDQKVLFFALFLYLQLFILMSKFLMSYRVVCLAIFFYFQVIICLTLSCIMVGELILKKGRMKEVVWSYLSFVQWII